MGSAKQHIYCQLIYHGFVLIRAQPSAVNNASLANLLHNIHRSILDSDFVENDIGFVNHAIPNYLQQVGNKIEPNLARLLVAFYDAVPEQLRPQVTWHPSTELRALTPSQLEQEALLAPLLAALKQMLARHT